MYLLSSDFRASGAQFWRIKCLKSAPKLTCFVPFYFKMCVSPQRQAIFRQLNFKKCSVVSSFLAFSLPNVLFATTACNFGTSEFQKVPRCQQFFSIFASKCDFRHNGVQFWDIRTSKSAPNTSCFVHFHFQMHVSSQCVQFLISLLSTYLRTRRLNRPTFRLTRHRNHRKNTAFRDVSNIWRGCIFFLLIFALVHLFTFDLTACLICFSTVHIVGSLLFKLPSIISGIKS